jgi:hypothetical protein
VIVSLFIHVTVEPAVTVIGFGEYALVVNPAEFMTMDTVVPDGAGVGDDGDDEPQPNEKPRVSAAKRIRSFKMLSSWRLLPQRSCPAAPRDFASKSAWIGQGVRRSAYEE